jgi:hypothetical protein
MAAVAGIYSWHGRTWSVTQMCHKDLDIVTERHTSVPLLMPMPMLCSSFALLHDWIDWILLKSLPPT